MAITLGDHGEGYCRACHFIEPLTGTGRISLHERGRSAGYGIMCPGSHIFPLPPEVVPRDAPEAAFQAEGRTALCPGCHSTQTITASDGVMVWHPYPFEDTRCPGVGRKP